MNKLGLTQDVLNLYFGGQVKIMHSSGNYRWGEIKTISLEDGGKFKHDRVRIKLLWMAIFPYKSNEFADGTLLSGSNEEKIDLETFVFPEFGETLSRSIRIYSQKRLEEITFFLANSGGNLIDPFSRIKNLPYSFSEEMKYAKDFLMNKLDLSKISSIDFEIDDLTLFKNIKFIRVDLRWRNKIWYFIRKAKKHQSLHNLMFCAFLNEVADQFSLMKEDIKQLVGGDGGGQLYRKNEQEVIVQGPGITYIQEDERDLTRNLLKEYFKIDFN